jgi:hypothetical protein
MVVFSCKMRKETTEARWRHARTRVSRERVFLTFWGALVCCLGHVAQRWMVFTFLCDIVASVPRKEHHMSSDFLLQSKLDIDAE